MQGRVAQGATLHKSHEKWPGSWHNDTTRNSSTARVKSHFGHSIQSLPWPATWCRPLAAEGATGPQRPLRYWESRANGDKTAIIPRLNGLHGWGNLTRLVPGGSRGLRSPYAQNSSQSQLHIAVVIVQDRSRSSAWQPVSNDAPHHNVSTSTGRTRYAHDLSITRSPLTDSYHLLISVNNGTTFKHTDSATFAVVRRAAARKVSPALRFGIFHRIESIRRCVLAQCERPVRMQPH